MSTLSYIARTKSANTVKYSAFDKTSITHNPSRDKTETTMIERENVCAQAAIATNGPECAQIGANMLKRNGSAVDAAIAALLCEGIASLHR